MNNIILIGFAATGKTTVGALLAEKLGKKFVDTDAEAERAVGKTVTQIFSESGEKGFRKLENEVLHSLSIDNAVIACGGGSVLCQNFAEFARGSKVVCLTAEATTVASRLNGGRPLLEGLNEQQLRQFVSQRERVYRRFADVTVCTDGLSARETADLVAKRLEN